jgi:hypothetical protein
MFTCRTGRALGRFEADATLPKFPKKHRPPKGRPGRIYSSRSSSRSCYTPF